MTIFIGGAEMGYDVELIAYMPTKDSGYLVLEKIGDEYQIHHSMFIKRRILEVEMTYELEHNQKVKRLYSSRSKSKAMQVYEQNYKFHMRSPWELITDRSVQHLFK